MSEREPPFNTRSFKRRMEEETLRYAAKRLSEIRPADVRVIVCGSRNWIDAELIEAVIQDHLDEHGDRLVIVHGKAKRGADAIADDVAKRLGVRVEAHPADWEQFGKAAGHIRNEEMAKLGAVTVEAFWDGKSRGTWGMVEAAKRHGIHYAIHFGKPGGASVAV